MTTEDKLLADLEDARWFCMRRIANHMEETGQPGKARVWRWLADNKKYPYPSYNSAGEITRWKWHADAVVYVREHHLPLAMYQHLTTRQHRSVTKLLCRTVRRIVDYPLEGGPT